MSFNIIIRKLYKKGGNSMKIGTYQPNKRKRAKKHGFFARKETNILKRRRKKGRKELCK